MATSIEPSSVPALPDGSDAATTAAISSAAPAPAPASAVPAPTATAVAPRVLFGELTSAGSALVLLIVLFATKWYGVAGVPDPSAARPAVSTAESGWDGLSLVRWVILGTALAALASVLLHASQRRHGTKTDTSRLVAGLGLLSAGLLVYRVLIVLPTGGRVIDQKFGALVALACAFGIALGGYESIEEHRVRASTVVQRSRKRRGLASGRRMRDASQAPQEGRGEARPEGRGEARHEGRGEPRQEGRAEQEGIGSARTYESHDGDRPKEGT